MTREYPQPLVSEKQCSNPVSHSRACTAGRRQPFPELILGELESLASDQEA